MNINRLFEFIFIRYYINILMLEFGKYKGKKINEINDFNYIQFLSNYGYGMCCTDLDSEYDEYTSKCKHKLIVYDMQIDHLNFIYDNKESYINYWNYIDSEGGRTKLKLINPKNEIWNKLDNTKDDIEKIKIIYNNRNYFDYSAMKLINKQKKIFGTFYLILNYPNVIKEVRNYLKDNRICLHCGIKMPPISTYLIDDSDWEIRMFHEQCSKEIINF